MAIPLPLSGDVIMILLFLARFVRVFMYLLGRFCVGVWWFVVDAIKPCMNPLLKSESVCL